MRSHGAHLGKEWNNIDAAESTAENKAEVSRRSSVDVYHREKRKHDPVLHCFGLRYSGSIAVSGGGEGHIGKLASP
jgi:hypothetical protein